MSRTSSSAIVSTIIAMLLSAHALVACGPPPDTDAADDSGDVDAGNAPDAMPDAPLPQLSQLLPDPQTERAGFGRAMAVSGDTLVVGATNGRERTPGAAYVFVRRDGQWQQQAKLAGDAGGVAFAEEIAIGGDTIAVTERMPGASMDAPTPRRVHVFTRSGAAWSLAQTLAPAIASSNYGRSVAVEGDTIVVGDGGHYVISELVNIGARVYVRDGATWVERASLLPTGTTPSWKYGAAVAIDGDRIAVSDPRATNAANETTGNVYLFGRDGAGAWQHASTVTPQFGNVWPHAIGFGDSVALEGDRLVVGVSDDNCVSARVYELAASTWNLVAKLDPHHNACGFQMARVAMDGDHVAVGATGAFDDNPAFRIEGAAYIFEKSTAGWSELPVTTVRPEGAVSAGTSIVLTGETLLVGAPASGTVYLWRR